MGEDATICASSPALTFGLIPPSCVPLVASGKAERQGKTDASIAFALASLTFPSVVELNLRHLP